MNLRAPRPMGLRRHSVLARMTNSYEPFAIIRGNAIEVWRLGSRTHQGWARPVAQKVRPPADSHCAGSRREKTNPAQVILTWVLGRCATKSLPV
jgi:hypothetical protein